MPGDCGHQTRSTYIDTCPDDRPQPRIREATRQRIVSYSIILRLLRKYFKLTHYREGGGLVALARAGIIRGGRMVLLGKPWLQPKLPNF